MDKIKDIMSTQVKEADLIIYKVVASGKITLRDMGKILGMSHTNVKYRSESARDALAGQGKK